MNGKAVHDQGLNSKPRAYGVIFCGPPGHFSVWTVTPTDRLMDRETAERIGLFAIRSGAADYRIFALSDSGDDQLRTVETTRAFFHMDDFGHISESIQTSEGVPQGSGPQPGR